MYIAYQGADRAYAYVKESKRVNGKVESKGTYLGKVADKELGVFYTPERGFFTYDVATGQYGNPPDAFLHPVEAEPGNMCMNFGGIFFLNAFLHRTGMMELIDSLPCPSKDSLRALVLFYILSPLASSYAESWFHAGFAKMLYPGARLASQRISEILEAIGCPDSVRAYQKRHVAWVLGRLAPDTSILVDSTALENSIDMALACPGVHKGKVEFCRRFLGVVQQGSGMPLFFKSVSGNTLDLATLQNALDTAEAMDIKVSSCIIDAGYSDSYNFDLFYDDNNSCTTPYIARIRSNNIEYQQEIESDLDALYSQDNIYEYEKIDIFIKKRQIFVGKNKDNPAFLYLTIDTDIIGDEVKSIEDKSSQKDIANNVLFRITKHGGLFAVISGTDIPCEEILPAYYNRQVAGQFFDFLKNYTKIMPLECWTEAAVQGHLLLSFIASTVVSMLSIVVKPGSLGTLESLRSLDLLGCTRCEASIVVDPLQKKTADVFKAAGIACPHRIPLAGGRLSYTPPPALEQLQEGLCGPEAGCGAEPGAPVAGAGMDGRGEGRKSRSTGAEGRKTAAEAEVQSGAEAPPKRKPGRPKGSRNKKTLEREAKAQADAQSGAEALPKRKPGRPKGSRNKKTLEREAKAQADAQSGAEALPKRKPGRPKGSKNKKTLEREAARREKYPEKRGRGRPKGSRNKNRERAEAGQAEQSNQPD